MPKRALRRVAAVTADAKPFVLNIRWDNGDENHVDVAGIVGAFRAYAPLRLDPDLFRKVRVGEHGVDVVWNDEIDMAADTLWRLSQEQGEEPCLQKRSVVGASGGLSRSIRRRRRSA